MADSSKIEWTDATWNVVTGCSVVSPGCRSCYAMRLAGGRLQHHPSRAGLTDMTKAGPVWNGEVRLNEEWIEQPLRWRKPRKVFVCAHGDLFHEYVPDDWIDQVFAVMALAPQHTFQLLTKRSARMREYVNFNAYRAPYMPDLICEWMGKIGGFDPRMGPDADSSTPGWPLPNVWLGVSAEDQTRADERIPDLLATPAAVRFVSAEPLLGPLELGCKYCGSFNALHAGECRATEKSDEPLRNLDWIITGGESGPHARDADPDWFRSIRDQCKAAGVAYFHKQMSHKSAIPEDLMVREWPV